MVNVVSIYKKQRHKERRIKNQVLACNKNHKATNANYLCSCFIQHHFLWFTLAFSSLIGWVINLAIFCSIYTLDFEWEDPGRNLGYLQLEVVCPLTHHLTSLNLHLLIYQIWVMPALPACQCC